MTRADWVPDPSVLERPPDHARRGEKSRHERRNESVLRHDGRVGVGGDPGPVHLGLGEPLGLCPPVLEPDLDLCLRELELGGELCTLRDGEVLLLFVLVLESGELLGGERSAGLAV